jgi:flagellar basal body-associated protein FliL
MSQTMNETPATRKAAIWVVIVFLLGAVGGGMLGYGFAHHSVSAANAPLPEPERRAKRVAQWTQDFGLSIEQAKQLDAILLELHGESKAIRDQSDAQMEQLRKKGREQIRAVLTPEQRPKFEDWLAKRDAERLKNTPK